VLTSPQSWAHSGRIWRPLCLAQAFCSAPRHHSQAQAEAVEPEPEPEPEEEEEALTSPLSLSSRRMHRGSSPPMTSTACPQLPADTLRKPWLG
jgi:hypothetical protein